MANPTNLEDCRESIARIPMSEVPSERIPVLCKLAAMWRERADSRPLATADCETAASALTEAIGYVEKLRAELESRGGVETCGGTTQMGCGCEVWMGAKGLATQPIGYRCSECEQPFCAHCIKGQKHATRWLEPCRDTELESWANQAIAAKKRVKELEVELEALRAELEPLRNLEDALIWMPMGRQLEGFTDTEMFLEEMKELGWTPGAGARGIEDSEDDS